MKKICALLVFFSAITCSFAQSSITGYEYWFNDDFENKTVTLVASTQHLLVDQTIAGDGLAKGLNALNFRAFDNAGNYSSVLSHFFYKPCLSESNSSPQIVAYEYWFNNDYSTAVLVNTPVQKVLAINEPLSTSSLNQGANLFNIRYKDNMGIWSSVISSIFYRSQESSVSGNMITGYRYWFNEDIANSVRLSIPADQQLKLLDNLDLTQLAKGSYEVHFQFIDTLGNWSVVLTDTIEKTSLPVADFAYSTEQYCDSAILSFTNASIDGDEYLWDFGDGSSSTLESPTHTFMAPGSYQVSLTAKDTNLGTDSTIAKALEIYTLHTEATISETACDSYQAPDGQVYQTSGTITAIIPNAAGCDSIITINLVINTVDTSVAQNGHTLTAKVDGATYQWLDCNHSNSIISGETGQSFTASENGSYAVEITQNSCTDTSACFAITTIGIPESATDNEIAVYPNPTDGKVRVNLGEMQDEFTLSIHDTNGRLISQANYKQTKELEINLDVQPGIYILTIDSESTKTHIRLVKY